MRAAAVLAAVALLALTSCSMVRTSTRTLVEQRRVAGFDVVEVSGAGTVLLTQTGSESLTVEASERLMPRLTSDVFDRTLRLGVRPGTMMMTSRSAVYRVSVATLHGLLVSGSADVEADSLRTDSLAVRISGSGSVRASGTAADQELVISGSGSFDGAELAGHSIRVVISGSGSASVSADRNLTVDISGSGSLRYGGSPRLVQRVTGSGRIVQR